jgi:DNA gyrase/topoisomerase IV subunit B
MTDSIYVPRTLREGIQRAPRMYLGRDLDANALTFVIGEVIVSAVGERQSNRATSLSIKLDPNGRITLADNGRGIPVDTYYGWIYAAFGDPWDHDRFKELMQQFDHGRHVPDEILANPKIKVQSILEVTLTRVFTGEATRERYEYFGHLHFDGAILNALCSEFCIKTCPATRCYSMCFAEGEATGKLELIDAPAEQGTEITFVPNLALFNTSALDYEAIKVTIEKAAITHPSVTFLLEDEHGSHYRYN